MTARRPPRRRATRRRGGTGWRGTIVQTAASMCRARVGLLWADFRPRPVGPQGDRERRHVAWGHTRADAVRRDAALGPDPLRCAGDPMRARKYPDFPPPAVRSRRAD